MNFFTTIMGSGAAIPTLARHCSAQSVNINGFRMLLDCGEGTQNQLRAYHQKLQSFSLVCISHLHGDHLFGLPGLLSTMHLCGRTEPIDVVGPKGLKAILEPIFLFSNTILNYELRITELEGNDYRQVFEERRCKVFAFPLRHSVPTYGYVIEEIPRSANSAPRRYAYCCDTAYDETILPYIQNVNLLCMESTFANDFQAVADEKLHCTAAQAATLAQKANAKQLLLTHFSARYKELDTLMAEAQAIFPAAIAAHDGERYGI
ncbi:MAG: ribonuclease Z [Bacteroidales bacterium]|nr:ribonuclease Z [Candidatus Colimorpha pelethequi]